MTRLIYCFSILALLLFFTGCNSISEKSNKFQMKIQTNKTIFSAKEPIRLFYKYRNITKTPQKLCKMNFWANNKVILKTTDGTPIILTELGKRCQAQLKEGLSEYSRPFSLTIKPNQYHGSNIRNLRQFFELQSNKSYKLQVIYYDLNAPKNEMKVYSNVLTFRIR